MQITISALARTSQEAGKAVARAVDGLRDSYTVVFVSDERTTNCDSSAIKVIHDIEPRGSVGGSSSQVVDGVQSAPEPIVSALKIDVDTSAIGAAIGKVEALQGYALGSVVFDPLESAIQSTVSLLRDERERESEAGLKGIRTVLFQRLESHLEDLLAEQLARVKAQ